jgi:hypothetical protein
MAITKVTNGGITDSAITSEKINDGSIINADIKSDAAITAGKLSATLDLSSKTVTLPAASVTAHATNPTKTSIEALGIALPAANLTGTINSARYTDTVATKTSIEALGIAASSITGALPVISGANLTGLVSTIAGASDATVSASDPTISANPSAVGHLWINSTSGEQFVATDVTTGANTWINTGEGAGSITGYRYIRYWVVSSSVSHHPRISRIYLLESDGTKVQIYNASASDNCSDSGDIPAVGANYTHDSGSGNTKAITGFGFYSTYSGGNRGSNIKLEGSSDNSTWTQIGSTIDAQSAASCGEKDFNV